jgi:hypothetical protein
LGAQAQQEKYIGFCQNGKSGKHLTFQMSLEFFVGK